MVGYGCVFFISSSSQHFVADGLRDTEFWPHTLFSITFRSFSSMMPPSFLEPFYTFASIMFYGSVFHCRIARKMFLFFFRLVACPDSCIVKK